MLCVRALAAALPHSGGASSELAADGRTAAGQKSRRLPKFPGVAKRLDSSAGRRAPAIIRASSPLACPPPSSSLLLLLTGGYTGGKKTNTDPQIGAVMEARVPLLTSDYASGSHLLSILSPPPPPDHLPLKYAYLRIQHLGCGPPGATADPSLTILMKHGPRGKRMGRRLVGVW
ncbi:unnamed protein product [Pleuronectes platessa]|uniref:Uncharacterized protein n=1 Tax=Pleuronectes platessa TaxID=8262 RepID=A0A9N7Y0E2_PLEPL|nr:unnamed protein product [Pleuronectes platessa]